MRRKLGRLTATTGVALAVAVLTATPADARRNVGGTVPAGAVCVQPGSDAYRNQPAQSGLPCVCISVDNQVYRNVGRGHACPPGVGG